MGIVRFACLATACSGPVPPPYVSDRTPEWDWQLPEGFPPPRVPADNPMSADKVELGRYLFYDPRLSGNGTQRCATCHIQRLAFTDGQITSFGSTGEPGLRNSPTIVNSAYVGSLTWADQHISALEQQVPLPLFGEDPVEMDLTTREEIAWDHLSYDPAYQELFGAVWPDDPTINRERVVQAIAAFVRSVVSADSAYDRYLNGDTDAMSERAVRGEALFTSERLACASCHGGFLLSESTDHGELDEPILAFHNNGLYNIDGLGGYPPHDTGLLRVTGVETDMGRFRPPSLRNVTRTAPYFHDGSAATLDEVLDSYARGGRRIEEGPYAGDGAENPFKAEQLTGFTLTAGERADLLAFLDALTDERVLTEPA